MDFQLTESQSCIEEYISSPTFIPEALDEIDNAKEEAVDVETELDSALNTNNFEKIHELVTPRTLMVIKSNTFEKSFEVSHKLKELSETKGTYEHRLGNLEKDVEAFAFHLLDPLKAHAEGQTVFSEEIDDLVEKAIEGNQKQFLAHPVVYDLIHKKWYGSSLEGKDRKGWCIWTFLHLWTLLDMLLFPLLFLMFEVCHRIKGEKSKNPEPKNQETKNPEPKSSYESYRHYFETPYFVYVKDTISYFALLLLHCALCLSASTISFSRIELAIIVFFVGRIMMELDQFFNDNKENSRTPPKDRGDNFVLWKYITMYFRTPPKDKGENSDLWKDITMYFRDTWNVLDFVSMLIFLIVIALRLVTLSSASLFQNHVLTAANYLYGLNTMCLTMRVFGSALESMRSIGVMQIALLKIVGQIVIIFWQFLVVILAFSFAITKIFVTEWSYIASEEQASAQLNVCKNGTFICWFSTIRHLAWSLFGLADMSDYESSDATSLLFMWMVYAVYLVVAVILLVNLTIALLSNVYQGVQDNSLAEWCFKRCVAYRTYRKYHRIPVPLNIVSMSSKILSRLVQKCFCTKKCRNGGAVGPGSSDLNSSKIGVADLIPLTEANLDQKIETSKELMKWLEAMYLSKYGSSFPTRESMDRVENAVNRIHHESVENQRMINTIMHQMFSDKESFDAKKLWSRCPGICIDGNTLTYNDEAEENRSACYKKPLTHGSPMFQVLIEESGKLRILGIGIVLSKSGRYYYDFNAFPGWRDKSVGYHIDDGRIYEENHRTFGRELPDALGFSGDLLGCKVLFHEEENGYVPVSFSLNSREVGRTKIKKYSDEELYPCIGMGSAGIKVKFSMGTFDQSILKGVKGEIQGVKKEIRDLKSQISEMKDMLLEIKGATQRGSK